MNLQEQTNRIKQMMGINESMFFRRRSNIEVIKELLPYFVNDVFNDEDYQKSIKEWNFGSDVLIEKFIPGREIHVAVIDDKAIGAIEIKPLQGFYDYAAKYTPGKADHIMPAPLSPDAYQEVLNLAEKAHKVLGCHGVTRSDFIYDEAEKNPKFYILELNTQPGMTPLSLVPEIAAHVGISFKDLLERKIKAARCHQELHAEPEKQTEATLGRIEVVGNGKALKAYL